METTIITQISRKGRIEKKMNSTFAKMEGLYAQARILRSELDVANGKYTEHTSASSLIHELDN